MDLAATLQHAWSEVPLEGVVVGTSLAVLVAELAILRVARGARGRELATASRVLELCAWIAPGLVFVATVMSMQQARSLMLRALVGRAEDGQLVAHGVQGEQAAIVIGGLFLSASGVLACIAAGYAGSARSQRSPALLVSTYLAIVAGGLAPVCFAIWWSAVEKLAVLGSALDPGAKLRALEAAVTAGQDGLARGLLWTTVTTSTACVIACVATWSAERADKPNTIWVRWLAVAAVLASAMLFGWAGHLKRENDEPWPAGTTQRLDVSTSMVALQGTDPVPNGPVVEVTSAHVLLDRAVANSHELARHLAVQRRQFDVLHPESQFAGAILVICAPETPASRVSEVLDQLAAATYVAPTFVFETTKIVQRPVLGAVKLHELSGAQVRLVHEASPTPNSRLLDPREETTCARLSERIVEARRSSFEVQLRVSGAHQP